MGIWKMDRNMARYILHDIYYNGGVRDKRYCYEECPKCGASYIPSEGHDCNDVIELNTKTTYLPDDDGIYHIPGLEEEDSSVTLKKGVDE
jgi:uncharacterized OB-fold protein